MKQDPEILKYIKIEKPKKFTSGLDQQIVDLNILDTENQPKQKTDRSTTSLDQKLEFPSLFVLSDHDIFYMMRSISEINGIATLKVKPYDFHDFRELNSNKIKILPLPLKDINYGEIPLTYKIRNLKKKLLRQRIMELPDFKEYINNHDMDFEHNTMKIDALFENEELMETFKIPTTIEIDIYEFPHYVGLLSVNSFKFNTLKSHIKNAFEKLNITNESRKGFALILSTEYIFVAPIINPYITNREKEIPIFVDPMFFTGIYNLPVVDAQWPDTLKSPKVKFDLLEILKKTTTVEI